MSFFSLLPLEMFYLDRDKLDDSKKEEEKRRYMLIPRSFTTWLQAFAILASVIGERPPENCSALFCYLHAIRKAWLRDDEHLHQPKALRPSLCWDRKDISLWMWLMTSERAGTSLFQSGGGGSSSTADKRKGFCWSFNEGSCKFGTTCKFKHEFFNCGAPILSIDVHKEAKAERGSLQEKGKALVSIASVSR